MTPRGTQRAWLELDPAAIAANVAEVRRVAGPSLTAVVKADGYGHGAATVAHAALGAGARAVAVATPQAAHTLRAAGVTAPIQVLGAVLDEELELALAADAQLTVHAPRDVKRYAALARHRERPLDVHVMVDVGMHRHGVAPTQALVALRACRGPLRPVGLMTHLPCAADAALDTTRAQVGTFRRVVADAAVAGVLPEQVHAAASCALFRLPEARFNHVRSGIALVGLDPGGRIAASGARLTPALSLRAKVVGIKRVARGAQAGYSGRWTAPRDSVLAIVGIGYGDGLPYTLTGRGAEVLLGGRRCPLVGSVMMDYVLVDVTDAPGVGPGDVATFAGRAGELRIPLEEQASKADLIPYALVCSLGAHLRREVQSSAAIRLVA
ncbi:MAG: alanine racemase [Planctomycetes bacterium]|nr:alanine racemase [Planctomycetota bacterium]